MESIAYNIPILVGLIACYTDIKNGKIRNKITYPLIVSGVVIQTATNGIGGLKSAILGIAICFILLSILPGTRFSGGDVKLSMGFGAYLGMNAIYYILVTLTLFIITNIYFIVRKHGLSDLINRLKLEVISLGKVTANADKITGAPILLFAYVTVCFFIYGGVNILFT